MKALKILCAAMGVGIVAMVVLLATTYVQRKRANAPAEIAAPAPPAPAPPLPAGQAALPPLPAGAVLRSVTSQPDHVLLVFALADGGTALVALDPLQRRAPVVTTLPLALPQQ